MAKPAAIPKKRRYVDDGDNVLPFRRARRKDVTPYADAIPIFDLKFAASTFADGVTETGSAGPEHDAWAVLPDVYRPQKGLFVARVFGESMNRRIPNGSWCLFKADPAGTRNSKVVVAEHRSIDDPETGGSYTIKVYRSKKESRPDGSWRHLEIRLRPDSSDPGFKELVFGPDAAGSVRIVAEMITVL